MKTHLRKASHSVFNIQLHIVFVTKYRRGVINKAILERLEQTFKRLCEKRQNILVEFSGEVDPREDKKSGGLYQLILPKKD